MDSNKYDDSFCFLKQKSKKIIKLYKNKKFDLFTPYMKLKQYLDSLNENYENYVLEDFLIYGINCEKIKEGKKIEIILYLSEYDESEIILLEKNSGNTNSINLNKLHDISFDIKDSNNNCISRRKSDDKININNEINNDINIKSPKNNNNTKIKKTSSPLNSNKINSNCQIIKNINNDNKKYISLCLSENESFDLIFKSEQILKNFIINIFSLYKKKSIDESKGKPELNIYKKYLIKIWKNFEYNKIDYLDYTVFKKMIKYINEKHNFILRGLNDEKYILEVLRNLDKDNLGEISLNDFLEFVEENFIGMEFEELFLKYSNGKKYMYINDLINFFNSEQKENFSEEKIINIISNYKIENSDINVINMVDCHNNNNNYK
jgi:hypothetical protein